MEQKQRKTSADAGKKLPDGPVRPPNQTVGRDTLIDYDISHFFKQQDWLAALVTFIFSGLVFFYYMAPEVTLQDSGELVTGAFTFGVPHPPGYPLWALLGYIWSNFIVPFGNPAWRIGMMSVVTGALVVGVMTLMMTRSIRLILNSLPWTGFSDNRLTEWVAITIGMSSALLFGFNRGVWLWACVSEMRVLNVFSFVLISCFFFGWMIQPHRRGFLHISVFLFGVSLANHQTIAVMAGAFAIGTFVVGMERFFISRKTLSKPGNVTETLMRSLNDFWELGAAGGFAAMTILLIFSWLEKSIGNLPLSQQHFMMAITAGIIAIIILFAGKVTGWWQIKRSLISAGLLHFGVSFYLYMPLAASTNPPMNWGYAATKEGFLHAITRGQYEKMQTANFFSDEFFIKIKVFTQALIGQYSLPLTFFALVALVFLIVWWTKWKPSARAWMVFVWTAYLVTSFGLLTIINPKLDRQEQEITIKFFAPAHGFFAMLIGYGIALTLSFIAWRWRERSNSFISLVCIGLMALPVITYTKNWSLCALRGHDFGYLFGYYMFKPGGGYPDMEKDAVLYGGTDPGRFVPTYMIFCESRVAPRNKFRDPNFDRSDVYIITQNALADTTYMSYIRDHYDFTRPRGDDTLLKRLLRRDTTYPVAPIAIPSPADSAQAFQKYVQGVQSGAIPPSADLKIENGRVSVQGVGGVMAINGILAQWIFEKNKDKHAFYVEESYVIPWMYPYLRPHGVIMKIDKDPLPPPQVNTNLWAGIIALDRAYWDELTTRFIARPEFVRNNDAKKSFSKMRSAIAGLYVYRGIIMEAEYAFKQSLQLCPESPEANFRLADLYLQQHRYGEAITLIENYLKLDIYNNNAKNFLTNIKNMQRDDIRRQEIEQQIKAKGGSDINMAIELAGLYQRLNMDGQFQGLTRNILSNTNLTPNVCQAILQLYGNARRWELLEFGLQRYLELVPNNFRARIDYGFAQAMQNKLTNGMASLKRAVELGGEEARAILRQDQRFIQLRQLPEFQSLVMPAQQFLDGKNIPKLLQF
ncbi:MAG: DUF2723 domain-containing protein [Kiritimatiellae bacterium]|nr:DUF2723 domain-containing protein [Kiritimatiellia bacterium]MDD5523177.1 DUF2723 domain-containing protein [Kiritimatiellia bacterium]